MKYKALVFIKEIRSNKLYSEKIFRERIFNDKIDAFSYLVKFIMPRIGSSSEIETSNYIKKILKDGSFIHNGGIHVYLLKIEEVSE